MNIIETTEGHTLLALTHEEEQSLAKSVMDCISMRRISGEFQQLLDTTFTMKCQRGSLINVDDFLILMKFYEHYNIDPPMIEDDDLSIWDDLDDYSIPNGDRKLEAQRTIIRIWREVWDTHPGIRAVSDTYQSFPGDDMRANVHYNAARVDEIQETLEAMFWTEVDRIEDEYECERRDAIRMVSDYIPRGDYSVVE